MNKGTDEYGKQTVEESLAELNSGTEQGLTAAEAAARLDRYGYNQIEEKEEPLWHRIFRRFWGPIPWMIEAAAILSAVVRKWEDFVVIMVMLLVNGLLDFLQENRAMNALKALKQSLTQEVMVLRDGSFAAIAVRELVPGDVIRLRIGSMIPADVQLLDGDYLSVDQAALTGESLPVTKKRGDVAYSNTIVKQGEMTALVVNTGSQTNFHSVVALVAEAQLEETSHFQKMVIQIGNFLIVITLVLVGLIFAVALSRHEDFLEIARFSLVLAVAAIPVALPAVLSVTMAIGALNLARRQAIVSRLVAIEELAGVDIFCSDKTGTLTKNEMRVVDPVPLGDATAQDLMLTAVLASRKENRDPIEHPIFTYLDEHFPDADAGAYAQSDFKPFDPIRKRTEASIRHGNDSFTAIKGAPQVVLELAGLSGAEAKDIERTVDELAGKGYRTLAVARGDGKQIRILGLVPLIDPPREDSREVIDEMRNHGVRVKMVTGDNAAIGREVGHMLGLDGTVMRSSELAARESEGASALEVIESVDVFAEVVPEDKYRIVETLQKADHIVAMTGDGVNDAPALKKADCGFAVANATDAARAAADIILTSPGLGVVNEAVRQARITFERMKSYSIFRIAETLRIILFMTLAIVVFNFYPVTALMIIILALLNDIPILAIAYDNTKVQKNPVRWNMREMLTVASTLGVAGVLSSFTLFIILVKMDLPREMIQSLFFAKLVIAGHGTIYNTRIDNWFWKRPYPSWILFWATFSTRVLGTLIAVYGFLIEPIGWGNALLMWGYALAWFVLNDAVKMGTYRFLRHRGEIPE